VRPVLSGIPNALKRGSTIFTVLLREFDAPPVLHERVLLVLEALPPEVQRDFVDDARFRIALEVYDPQRGWSVLMHAPGPIGSDSRSVILRRKLADCSAAFAHYVIAHELAHAFLRNGGWGEITDSEAAADALAAHWGFPRPMVEIVVNNV
jgi:hypothetical protein